jgi:hypothetical protein
MRLYLKDLHLTPVDDILRLEGRGPPERKAMKAKHEAAANQQAWLNHKVDEAYAAWKVSDLAAREAVFAEAKARGLEAEFRVQWIGQMQGMN